MSIHSGDQVGSVPAQAGRPDRADAAPFSGHAVAAPPGRVRRIRDRWRRWRRTRPFWGALLVIVGATEILVSVRAPLPVVLHVGLQGMAGYLIPLVLLSTGLLLMFHPQQRAFYSIVSIVLALATWLTSNLGGFFIGMLCALVGGSLAFAWAPVRRKPAPATPEPSGEEAPTQVPVPADD